MIVVFGSINLDQVMRLSRLPRPGETALAQSSFMAPGGKGANQALAAARAGAQVAMVGRVGEDWAAQPALALLENSGVDLSNVWWGNDPTGSAHVWVEEGGENQIVVAPGANATLAPSDAPDALLAPGRTLLLQMEVPPKANWAMIRRAKAAQMRVVLNLAPASDAPGDALSQVDRLMVNEGEARALSGLGDARAAARALAAQYGLVCIVTLGKEGAIAVGRGFAFRAPALPVKPVDTTGAGDAFVGAFTAYEDMGHTLKDALARASVAGALACLAAGCQPAIPLASAIEARLADLPPVTDL